MTPIEQHQSAIGEITRDCVVPPPAGVAALGAPAALEYPDRSLWIWDELELEGGRRVETPAAVIASAGAACQDGPALVRDGAGEPVPLIALTAEEQLANETRTDGRRLALVPHGGFVQGGAGFLYYDHVLRGPGLFDTEIQGTGLCELATPEAPCRRVMRGGSTLLWPAGARVFDRGGIVVGERALLYGCRAVASFSRLCTVASAPVASLEEPAAYQVYNALRGWVDALTDASVLADELGGVTVSPYGGGFLATSIDIFDARVSVRRSARPENGFGHRIAAFDGIPSTSGFGLVSGGREHAGLRARPDEIVVSYRTDAGAPELHLVAFRFFGDFE
ncbi:MAG TPA: hypothetical protein VNO30_13075 [Kofleriaceae bacterium]|nr:hypothetical protein [Kofleriaceae bacterium]